MEIKYFAKITDPGQLSDILDLLTICNRDFVPPLSDRNSTTQSNLLPSDADNNVPTEYFKDISSQSAILALEGKRVVGFMSFREDYVCEHIARSYLPNIYITTVIVHPQFRHRGIAGKLYAKIMKQFRRRYLFTRTWSTNTSHIRILISLGFHEHCYLDNDRGEGIDTIYYRFSPRKSGILQYIEQYRLGGNVFFFLLLALFSVVFIAAWINTDEGIFHELSLAIATSLMASVLCLLSDTFLKYRESKNDSYINSLKSFGIDNLQFNKNEILESIIPQCRHEIWISGCRLIMTSKSSFRKALILACKRSGQMRIKLLATPPWSTAYQLTYGTEDVSLNYIRVLRDLVKCTELHGTELEVHFSEKPLFSDTYKVDDRFITGPYLHCTDRYNNRITAKDFFSMDISDPQKELYQIIHSDYMTLWREATTQLNLQRFAEYMRNVIDPAAITPEERITLLMNSCDPIKPQR